MPLLSIEAFRRALPPTGAVLGLDPGERRIGVAVSDSTRVIASPLEIAPRGRFADLAARLFALLDSRAGVGLVVGHALNMSGASGPAAQAGRAFARNMVAVRDLPLLLWDERLSTSAVVRQMIAADATRRQRAKVTDALAAAYMLQGALDALQEAALRAEE